MTSSQLPEMTADADMAPDLRRMSLTNSTWLLLLGLTEQLLTLNFIFIN